MSTDPSAAGSAPAAPEEPADDRRRRERRKGERRGAPPPTRAFDESWFGVIGGSTDGLLRGDSGIGDGESRFAQGWAGADQAADSRFMSRQARRLVGSGATAFQRIYRMFGAARAAIGAALLLAMAVGSLFGIRLPLGAWMVTGVYAAQATALWLMPRGGQAWAPSESATRLGGWPWLLTIGVDLLMFSGLHLFEPVSSLNYAALLVLPVLMGAVLTPRLTALATAAAATLILLAGAWRAGFNGADIAAAMTQAGLAGIGFFVITLLASELASRLAREELTARGSLEVARQQAQLNRLVIEEMGEGVLVIDRRARVRTINPAARRLLVGDGMAPTAPFALQSSVAWRPLVDAVEQAFHDGSWPDAGRDVALVLAPGLTRTLRVRMRFSRRRQVPAGGDDGGSGEEFCVLFVEDLLTIHARTRQEKLAAMGRVSAGIAHEIRNPLAAISQANALMQEDDLAPGQQQLARMVADNVERLKRIVDDVMAVAPGASSTPPVIDAAAEVTVALSEWARLAGIPARGSDRLITRVPDDPMPARFDPHHLRRVLVNLLDNAWRHASEAPGAVGVDLRRGDAGALELRVSSDGPAIPSEVERHLFEPFFSTRSRGTGLGLYICRELCDRYGARIDYRALPEAGRTRNQFIVTMRSTPPVPPPARPLG